MFSTRIATQIYAKICFETTSGQKKIIEKLSEYLADDDFSRIFVLNGYAGTGKTTLIAALVGALKDLNIKPVLLAPTGRAAKVLARRFGTLQALAQATEEELTAIDDVGPITAAYIRQWMDSPQSQDLMHRLEAAGVNVSCKEEILDSRFAGMTFVLTGSLEKFTREEAGQMIEQRGGRSASSVSKKTTYVVAGPDAGSKLRRAQELNIPVLTEDEFLELLK